MLRVAADDPAAWLYFSQLATGNFIRAIDLIAMLRRDNPTSRLAALLLILVGLASGRVDRAATVVTVSQTDLGTMAQLGRTTINVALSHLEAQGLIERGDAAVNIVDRGGLAQVGNAAG